MKCKKKFGAKKLVMLIRHFADYKWFHLLKNDLIVLKQKVVALAGPIPGEDEIFWIKL